MDENRPGYYAIIPADVRYDDSIPPNAKLLYGEISALIGAEGFCYASNSYFMRIYKFSDPTVTRLITSLEKAGYIKRVMERDETGQVVRRKIYLSVSVPEIQPPINFDTTPHQNCGEGTIKNDGYTNTSNTNILKENIKEKPERKKSTPLTDEQIRTLCSEWIRGFPGADWSRDTKNALYLAFMGFYYPREKKKQDPARTQAAFTALSNRLARYSEGNPLVMIDMLERATTAGWKSVFPINDVSTAAAPADEGVKRTWI